MTLPLKTLKSTRLRAASSAVFPRATVVVVGKLSPSVTPVTVEMVAAEVPMGKIWGILGWRFLICLPGSQTQDSEMEWEMLGLQWIEGQRWTAFLSSKRENYVHLQKPPYSSILNENRP